MAAQQAQFAETIRAMKLALKRKADDSDSSTSIQHPTNRGQKLKRHARYVRQGRLDTTGRLAYRQKITHAGYTRSIIANKPTLYDDDGDVFASPPPSADENDSNEYGEHGWRFGAQPIEDDAFGDVRLEYLLRPLTRASELPDHPTLALAYKSKALTQMTEEALEMVRREQESLWKAKRLLLRFRGDADWVPCEAFEGEADEGLLDMNENEDVVDGRGAEVEMADGGGEVMVEGKVDFGGMDGVQTLDMAARRVREGKIAGVENVELLDKGGDVAVDGDTNPDINGERAPVEGVADNPETIDQNHPGPPDPSTTIPTTETEPQSQPDPETLSDHSSKENANATNNNAPSHSMTTRARARSPIPSPSPSPTPSDSASISQINPWYNIPLTAIPDRDLGLPSTEAEDTRRMLLLYVQKQEQIVRSLSTLYEGLQRADRLRAHVYRSSKAEGHMRFVPDSSKGAGEGKMVTEMSDGEDWYDVEEWGLGWADLKVGRNGVLGLEKGKDEADDFGGDEGDGGRRVGGRRRRVARM